MSLADKLSAATPTSKGAPGCRVGWITQQLDQDDAQALDAALAVPTGDPERLSSASIAKALADEGFEVHNKTVQNHRKGLCRCEPGRAPDA